MFDGLNRDIIVVYESEEDSIFRVVFDVEGNEVVDLFYFSGSKKFDKGLFGFLYDIKNIVFDDGS